MQLLDDVVASDDARLRRARAEDQPAVEALLAGAGLPLAGVAESFGGFIVAEADGRVVGTIGLESYGELGLLRSAVVSPEWRGRGLGVALTARLIGEARLAGCRSLYLLTTTSEPFFERFGFHRIGRSAVPAPVRDSVEFQSACPDIATAMELPIMNATHADTRGSRPPFATTRGVEGGGQPPTDPATLEFHRALSELIRIYQFRDRDRICCYDISVSQCYALETLSTRGPLTLNDLAAELYLDKSTTSRVVDSLERKGYVIRNPHPEDRRALLLEPTPEGSELFERIENDILAEEQRLLSEFDPEVREAMTRLISRLVRVAAARVDTSGGTCCRVD